MRHLKKYSDFISQNKNWQKLILVLLKLLTKRVKKSIKTKQFLRLWQGLKTNKRPRLCTRTNLELRNQFSSKLKSKQMPSKTVIHLNKMLMFLIMEIILIIKSLPQLGKQKIKISNSKQISKSMKNKMPKKRNWKKRSNLSKTKLRRMLLILMRQIQTICKVKLLQVILVQL